MTTGADVVAKARTYRGNRENPMGSNSGTFVQACQHATFLGGTGWPWCAAFVCYVAKMIGHALAYNGAGAHDIADHHKPWVAKADWKPGMVVDYNEGTGHTGILTGVDHARGVVTSIDGNWNDQVTEHEMPMSIIRAVWRIPGVTYVAGTAPAPDAKTLPPFVVTTTSATGHTKVLFTTRSKHRLTRWLNRHILTRVAPNGITIHRGKAR